MAICAIVALPNTLVAGTASPTMTVTVQGRVEEVPEDVAAITPGGTKTVPQAGFAMRGAAGKVVAVLDRLGKPGVADQGIRKRNITPNPI